MSLLLPGNPEFHALLKSSRLAFRNYTGTEDVDMSGSHGISPVQMSVATYDQFEMHHGVISQNEQVSKIVLHFKKISRRTAEALSRFLYHNLVTRMKVKASIQAGESPEFRAQWDLILFHVPAFEVKMLYTQILDLIEIFVGK